MPKRHTKLRKHAPHGKVEKENEPAHLSPVAKGSLWFGKFIEVFASVVAMIAVIATANANGRGIQLKESC